MPGRNESSKRPKQTTSELLDFHDELTELNACNAFIMQALATALTNGSGLDERSSTGAVFCAQWLNDRTVELGEAAREGPVAGSRVCRDGWLVTRPGILPPGHHRERDPSRKNTDRGLRHGARLIADIPIQFTCLYDRVVRKMAPCGQAVVAPAGRSFARI